MARPIVIHADWDPEAEVWVATTSDMRCLVTEATHRRALGPGEGQNAISPCESPHASGLRGSMLARMPRW